MDFSHQIAAPRVSVIVPNYNHASFIERRLASVFGQTMGDFELIVLDDASTDDSRQRIEPMLGDRRISHYVVNPANSGSTFRQWQLGLSLARAPFVWIAESDDVAEPRFLETLLAAFDAHPGLSLAFCRSHQIDSAGRIFGQTNLPGRPGSPWAGSFVADGNAFVRHEMLFTNPIGNASAVLFRRQAGVEVDTSYTINGDWHFWITLARRGHVNFHAEPLNHCRLHDNNGSRANVVNFNNVREYYRLLSVNIDYVGTENREQLLCHVFNIWVEQSRRLHGNVFNPHFEDVYRVARDVDEKLDARLVRYSQLAAPPTPCVAPIQCN